jgi:hypothetical protein
MLQARPVLVILIGTAVLLAGISTAAYALIRPTPAVDTHVPQSAALESKLGVRFSRIAVVGDGGLVQLNFVVLDPDKATAFEASLARPPQILSESRPGGTHRVSVMKQGHNLLAGQTYYLVYENTKGAIVPGGHATILENGISLEHVPVLG